LNCSFNTLLSEISDLKVIDAHEHLFSEAERVSLDADVFTLFDGYTTGDLNCAGMSNEDIAKLPKSSMPLETRWQLFEPYWKKIRHTSYARAVLITIKDIYGIDDLTSNTYQQLSTKIKAANKPGLYNSILAKKCKIEAVLNQGCLPGQFDAIFGKKSRIETVGDDECISHKKDHLFKNVYRFDLFPLSNVTGIAEVEETERSFGGKINSYQDLNAAIAKQARRAIRKLGCIGFKIHGCNYGFPKPRAITSILRHIRQTGVVSQEQQFLLQGCVVHMIIEVSIELQVPVAIHIGPAFRPWVNFHLTKPDNIIPWLLKYRDARFDVYHLGIPWQDETTVIARAYPNVWLNLCWTHIFSQRIAAETLIRILDIVPTNKIIGFGADYAYAVENVYGHLTMAREHIAASLSDRIDRNAMTVDQAIQIAGDWLYNTPKQFMRSDHSYPTESCR
jgi:uncharacterized protein